MDRIIITGGTRLKGDIYISGAKNAALPIMACALLLDGNLTISNIPKVSDIHTMRTLLTSHGAIVEVIDEMDGLTISINSSKINNFTADYEIVRKMRASIWVLGPLLARFGQAHVSLPGGCAIGARQVDLHLSVLEAMGAIIEIEDGYICAKLTNNKLHGTHFCFNKISVGATINAIMAACLADGETLLANCAQEPEIVDLCNCLVGMGACILGIGSKELHIKGVSKLHNFAHRIIPDRIEAGTYMIAAAITKGELMIHNINYHLIENVALKLVAAGVHIMETDTGILVKYNGTLQSVDIQTQGYPGFPTDLQAQFMSLATISQGVSVITENIFENRLMHVQELCRMGANIKINGNNAIVRGVKSLNGAEVMASDLRASVSLILAGLAASGTTSVRRVYHLDRGYQELEQKLRNCGANIKRVNG